jgi:hypothetical protein
MLVFHDEHIFSLEAECDILKSRETANQQSCRDQQHNRKCDLDNDQPSAQSIALS